VKVCATCGGQMPEDGAYCPICGKSASDRQPSSTVASADAAAGMRSRGLPANVAAMLCYLPIGPVGVTASVVFLVLEPYKGDRYVRFHAFQSLLLAVAMIVVSAGLSIVVGIVHFISPFLMIVFVPMWGLLWLAGFIVAVVLMIKAYHNEMFQLPYLGSLAERLARG
jgi:uncharacterized membrane protein